MWGPSDAEWKTAIGLVLGTVFLTGMVAGVLLSALVF